VGGRGTACEIWKKKNDVIISSSRGERSKIYQKSSEREGFHTKKKPNNVKERVGERFPRQSCRVSKENFLLGFHLERGRGRAREKRGFLGPVGGRKGKQRK